VTTQANLAHGAARRNAAAKALDLPGHPRPR
jgi:hypothetical protein